MPLDWRGVRWLAMGRRAGRRVVQRTVRWLEVGGIGRTVVHGRCQCQCAHTLGAISQQVTGHRAAGSDAKGEVGGVWEEVLANPLYVMVEGGQIGETALDSW